MRRRLLYSGALGLVALVIAGCGGDDGRSTVEPLPSTPEVPDGLTKAELIAQGDGICAEVNAAVGALGVADAATPSQAIQIAVLYYGMVTRLGALGSPFNDVGPYDTYSFAAADLSEAERKVRLAAERGDEEALAEAESEASSALASFRSAAEGYGFTQCSEGPSAPSPSAASGAGSAEEESSEGVEEEASEVEEEVAPETGGAGSTEGGGAGGGAAAGGGTEGGGESSGGEGSGGIGPG